MSISVLNPPLVSLKTNDFPPIGAAPSVICLKYLSSSLATKNPALLIKVFLLVDVDGIGRVGSVDTSNLVADVSLNTILLLLESKVIVPCPPVVFDIAVFDIDQPPIVAPNADNSLTVILSAVTEPAAILPAVIAFVAILSATIAFAAILSATIALADILPEVTASVAILPSVTALAANSVFVTVLKVANPPNPVTCPVDTVF